MEQEKDSIPTRLDWNPDAWRMVNVTGVEHEDVRAYLRAVFATGKLLNDAQQEEGLRRGPQGTRTPRLYSLVKAVPMWNGDLYKGFYGAVMAYRTARGKKPTFFMMHRTPRNCPAVIFQNRPQRRWSGTDSPFFLFAKNLGRTERDAVKRLFQPPIRPLYTGDARDVMKTWWNTEYYFERESNDEKGLERADRTFQLLEHVMPRVPLVDEKRYFRAARHNGFLRNVLREIQHLKSEYELVWRWKNTATWSSTSSRGYLSEAATTKKLDCVQEFCTRRHMHKEGLVDALDTHIEQLVSLTSALLDATEAAIPDMYKHDQQEQA